jgi:hypothetical protein
MRWEFFVPAGALMMIEWMCVRNLDVGAHQIGRMAVIEADSSVFVFVH